MHARRFCRARPPGCWRRSGSRPSAGAGIRAAARRPRRRPRPVTVTGTVRNAAGAPVAGAAITVDARADAVATTDAEGRFSVTLAAGVHAHPRRASRVRRGHARDPRRHRRRRGGGHRAQPAPPLRRGRHGGGRPRRLRRADDDARPGPEGDRGAEHRPGDAVPPETGPVDHPVLRLGRDDGLLVHLPAGHSAVAHERHAGRRAAERARGLGVLLRELRRLRQRPRQPAGAARRRHVHGGRGVVRRVDQLREHRLHRSPAGRHPDGRRQLRHRPRQRRAQLGADRRRLPPLRPGRRPGDRRLPRSLGHDAEERLRRRVAADRHVVLQGVRVRRARAEPVVLLRRRRGDARAGSARRTR